MRGRAVVCAVVLGALAAVSSCSAVGGEAVPVAAVTAVPGGTAGTERLEGWLDGSGKVLFGESASKDPAVQRALCDYLFGAPDQVGSAARLAGTVKLADDSGYEVRGSSGTGFRCVYGADGESELGLSVWSEPPLNSAKEFHLVSVTLPTGLYASSRYRAGREGPVMPDEQARRWMTAAGNRVAAAG